MSFLKQANQAGLLGKYTNSPVLFVTQIRTATKRVSGSRTNKNDSAGRRLGPKAYEGHFVKPGQIIMRQRGTRVHPGENVGLGSDHTIYALEPGYVRFYLDPFHPLRKYVGIALKQDLTLPTPHFEPRVRRFGYIPLEGAKADQEEAHMCRKEYLAAAELQRIAEKKVLDAALQVEKYAKVLAEKVPELSPEQLKDAAVRIHFISGKINVGETVEFAEEQATFNRVYDLELSEATGRITAEEAAAQKSAYIEFASNFDLKISVDCNGMVYNRMSEEEHQAAKADLRAKLAEFSNRIPSEEDKTAIRRLISTPGVFSHAERVELKHSCLPAVLPVTVPGTVVENPGKKLPKGSVAVRTFNQAERRIDTVVRTKEAFLS